MPVSDGFPVLSGFPVLPVSSGFPVCTIDSLRAVARIGGHRNRAKPFVRYTVRTVYRLPVLAGFPDLQLTELRFHMFFREQIPVINGSVSGAGG